MPDIYKRFANLTKKRDAMRLRIAKLQEELELLDSEVAELQKELAKHGLLRDLQPADVT
jgi:prefoldin subunit 5